MSDTVAVSVALDADPRNVSRARTLLREAMSRSGAEHLVESAMVVLSEVVTNAFVHAGSEIRLRVWATADGVRVEVEDGAAHLPTRRHYAATAGTGRGMQLMEELTDRWGAAARSTGKTVWFEIGDPGAFPPPDAASVAPEEVTDPPPSCQVTLRHVPVLMHAAWQEHAATLLREYLLHVLGDDHDILDRHAHASAAMSLLHDQLPGTPIFIGGPAITPRRQLEGRAAK